MSRACSVKGKSDLISVFSPADRPAVSLRKELSIKAADGSKLPARSDHCTCMERKKKSAAVRIFGA